MAGNDLGAILKRIDKRLEAVGMTDRSASMAAGMSPDGIRTMRRQWKAGKQRTATAHTLSMLSHPLQTTTEFLMNGVGDEDIRDVRVRKARGKTARRLIRKSLRMKKTRAQNHRQIRADDLGGALQIAGEVVAGTWREEESSPADDMFDVRVPAHPDYPLKEQFAVVVRGNSISRVAAYNDILVALDTAASAHVPHDGDLVIVSRNRAGLYEYTAKRFCISDDDKSVELRYDSLDPQYAKTTLLKIPAIKGGIGKDADDGSEIAIKGVVLLIIRLP